MRAARFELEAAPEYAGKAYRADGRRGLAYVVAGWELGPSLDGEDVERTGFVVIVAVGDDAYSLAMPEDLRELGDEDYCPGCGQLGCKAGH